MTLTLHPRVHPLTRLRYPSPVPTQDDAVALPVCTRCTLEDNLASVYGDAAATPPAQVTVAVEVAPRPGAAARISVGACRSETTLLSLLLPAATRRRALLLRFLTRVLPIFHFSGFSFMGV